MKTAHSETAVRLLFALLDQMPRGSVGRTYGHRGSMDNEQFYWYEAERAQRQDGSTVRSLWSSVVDDPVAAEPIEKTRPLCVRCQGRIEDPEVNFAEVKRMIDLGADYEVVERALHADSALTQTQIDELRVHMRARDIP